MFYAWTPTLSTLLPEANSQRARTKPDLLKSIPQRSESGDFLHAHRLCPYSLWYDKLPRIYHSCFRLLNAEMTRENKGTTMCFLPIQRIIIQFLYVLDKWENSKKKNQSTLIGLFWGKPTFVQLIWGTLYNYQRLRILSHAARWRKRGGQPEKGRSRGTSQERYLKVSPACLLSFLELLSKRKESQRLDFICWKKKKRGKKKSSKIKLVFLNSKLTSYRPPLEKMIGHLSETNSTFELVNIWTWM